MTDLPTMSGASAMYEILTYITIQKFNAEKRTAVPRAL
jgi:hypothetical protein